MGTSKIARESVGTCRAWAGWAAITQVHKGNQEQEGITEVQRPETARTNTKGLSGRSRDQERRRTMKGIPDKGDSIW